MWGVDVHLNRSAIGEAMTGTQERRSAQRLQTGLFHVSLGHGNNNTTWANHRLLHSDVFYMDRINHQLHLLMLTLLTLLAIGIILQYLVDLADGRV